MKKELEALEVLQNYIMVTEPLKTKEPYLKRLNAIRLALTKLNTIELLVDKKKFNTNDIELLRASIIEVLERDDDE